LQLAPLYLRAGRLLPVDLDAACRLQLLKLDVKRLAVGADAGISDDAILRVRFDQIFCNSNRLAGLGPERFAEVLIIDKWKDVRSGIEPN